MFTAQYDVRTECLNIIQDNFSLIANIQINGGVIKTIRAS